MAPVGTLRSLLTPNGQALCLPRTETWSSSEALQRGKHFPPGLLRQHYSHRAGSIIIVLWTKGEKSQERSTDNWNYPANYQWVDLGSRWQALTFSLGPRGKNWHPLCFLSPSPLCVTLLIGSNHLKQDDRVTSIPSIVLLGRRDKPALVTCEWGIVHHVSLWPPAVPSPIWLAFTSGCGNSSQNCNKNGSMCGYGSPHFPFWEFQGEMDTRLSLMEALIKSLLKSGSCYLVQAQSLTLLAFWCLQKSTRCPLIQNPVVVKAVKNYHSKKWE